MKKLRPILLLSLCLVLVGCEGLIVTPQKPASETTGAVSAPPQTAAPTVEPTVAQTLEPTAEPTVEPTVEPTPVPTPTPEPEPTKINVMAVGDIMFHEAQIKAAYNSTDKSYDFTYSYQFIKDIVSSADLALGNFECTLGGPKKPYSVVNSKSFNTPDSAADALAGAGFDILSTANNHTNDRGRDGVIRTVSVMREKGIVPVGTRMDANEKPYYIADVKGVKLGVTAYTFGSRNSDIVNCFSYNTAKELPNFEKMIGAMRADGAEIIMVIIHWGSEYQRAPGSPQKNIAKCLADLGVDVIFGSHPHVLQPVDVITSSKSGKKTFVAYSLGNFCANQIYGANDKFTYTDESMILNVHIEKKPDGSAPTIEAVEYLPTKTMRYTVSGRRKYTVVPLEKAIDAPEQYDVISNYDKNRLKISLGNTNKLMADAVAKGYITLMKLE